MSPADTREVLGQGLAALRVLLPDVDEPNAVAILIGDENRARAILAAATAVEAADLAAGRLESWKQHEARDEVIADAIAKAAGSLGSSPAPGVAAKAYRELEAIAYAVRRHWDLEDGELDEARECVAPPARDPLEEGAP